jgi:hypothetical protein
MPNSPDMNRWNQASDLLMQIQEQQENIRQVSQALDKLSGKTKEESCRAGTKTKDTQ